MKKVFCLVGVMLVAGSVSVLADFSNWKYHEGDLDGEYSLQERVDQLDNRLDGLGITSATGANDLTPKTDGTYDLGTPELEWQDLYIDGTANIDTLAADVATVTGNLTANGNILGDGSTIVTNVAAVWATTYFVGTTEGADVSESGVTNFDITVANGLITAFTAN